MRLRCPSCGKKDAEIITLNGLPYGLVRYACTSCGSLFKAGDIGRAFIPGTPCTRRVRIGTPRVKVWGIPRVKIRVRALPPPVRVRVDPRLPWGG